MVNQRRDVRNSVGRRGKSVRKCASSDTAFRGSESQSRNRQGMVKSRRRGGGGGWRRRRRRRRNRRPTDLQQYRLLGHRTEGEDASRFCPLPLMTERPNQNWEDGIGHGLNKISGIIARTAGSSSQSQPDPSEGTDV